MLLNFFENVAKHLVKNRLFLPILWRRFAEKKNSDLSLLPIAQALTEITENTLYTYRENGKIEKRALHFHHTPLLAESRVRVSVH